AGWKIDASAIGGVPAHFAEDEGAIGGAQRAHAEAVEDVAVRKAPVAPSQEACKVDREVARGEAPAAERRIAPEQHAPVPQVRLLALLFGKMRIDFGAPLLRERPQKRLDLQIKRSDTVNDGHAKRNFIGHCGTLFQKLRRVKAPGCVPIN